MTPTSPENLFCGDALEGAATGLLALMTGLSEEHWCAGWMTGLEFSLWQVEAGAEFGMGKITERQAALLRLLHEESGGWWVWRDGPVFVCTAEWSKMRDAA